MDDASQDAFRISNQVISVIEKPNDDKYKQKQGRKADKAIPEKGPIFDLFPIQEFAK
jgi:hypothetical protein